MTTAHRMLPTEFGAVAAEGLGDILRRTVGDANIVTQVEGRPSLTWKALEESDWDRVGIREDDDSASRRDLAAIAKVWGRYLPPLPYLETVLARRHSVAGAAWEGPVTFAVPTATLPDARGYIPFGQTPSIVVAMALGGGGSDELVVEVPGAEPDGLNLGAQGIEAELVTRFSPEAARDLAVMTAASAVGAAGRVLDDAVAYAKERQQFGKPIGVHQAVKHSLADGLIALERADTAAIWASLHDGEVFRGAAKAIEDSITVAEIAIQVHGGIGFTWEMGIHYYLRHMMAARESVAGLLKAHQSQPNA